MAACAAALAASGPSPCRAGVLDLIGYNDLVGRDGALRADGAGVDVAQVEVPPASTDAYAPDTSLAWLAGKTFTFRTGPTAASPHAAQVAALYYGEGTSAAPAVGHVSLFSAGGFVTDLLRAGRSNRGPGALGAQVVNNSWVASFNSDASNADVVRRLDHLIERDDVLVFNAVGNGPNDGIPKLLASSFNGISVGTLTAAHGPFQFDSSGMRIKPDLVVNTDLTSNATGLASGAGALLRSEAQARDLPAGELAIKAMLMAGADRNGAWHRGRNSGADNATAPLDFQQGAGQLRVDHAFDVLIAGRQAAGTTAVDPGHGWDSARTGRRKRSATYYLHVDQTMENWAAVLTWNRTIAGGQPDGTYSTAPTLADMDLSLYLSKRGGRRLLARSDSPTDNVETLTPGELAPGDYQLELTTDRRAYYALAWYADADGASASAGLVPAALVGGGMTGGDASLGFTAVPAPEPSSALLLGIAGVGLLSRRRRCA